SVSYGELLDSEPLAGVVPDRVALMPETRRKYSGKPTPHLEARDIVTGRATFVADVRLPGMARGAMVRPPARGAKLRSVDDAAADVRSDGATMDVGTHRPFGVREQIAKTVGLPEKKVRVLPQITSGTYGRNSHADAAIEAAILSKGAGRPVLLQWTREEE